jgi:hypothetical protein
MPTPRVKVRKPSILVAFTEDLLELARTHGYTSKEDYAQRMGLSIVAFNQRVCRARARGLLAKPGRTGCAEFRPLGNPCTCQHYS